MLNHKLKMVCVSNQNLKRKNKQDTRCRYRAMVLQLYCYTMAFCFKKGK